MSAPAERERPRPDALGFDPRLMSAARLLELTRDARLRFSEPGIPALFLDCAACGKGVEQLTDGYGHAYELGAVQLLASLLRHLVMSHGLSLSGGNGG